MRKLELKLSLIFLISALTFYIFSQEQRIKQLNSRLNQMENPGVIR